MTRRALLSMLALAAVDPERLIWQPGRKLISIPKPAPVPVARQTAMAIRVFETHAAWETRPEVAAAMVPVRFRRLPWETAA